MKSMQVLPKYGLKIIIITALLLCFCTPDAIAQRFSAAALLGINASQLDGDDQAGYNRLGLSAGLAAHIALTKSIDLGVEMLFNKNGSQDALGFNAGTARSSISLTYVDVPLLISFKDWYIDKEKFHRVKGELGMSISRLVDVTTRNSFFDDYTDDFNNSYYGLIVGGGYKFNKHWGINIRYTKGLKKIFDSNPTLELRGLSTYFFTFRTEYAF